MKTGIMGGTFNPVHNAHLLIAENALEQYKLDRIIFITSGNPPHKIDFLDAAERFRMTRLAIQSNDKFIDDDFEINRAEKSYTVNTLEYLKAKYPQDELFFIIGEDSLCDLPLWREPERILSMASILAFPRKSMETLDKTIEIMRGKYGNNIFIIDAPIFEISSTDIRRRIKDKRTVRYMVPDSVIQYIEENGFYV